jgi:hypothetical protein
VVSLLHLNFIVQLSVTDSELVKELLERGVIVKEGGPNTDKKKITHALGLLEDHCIQEVETMTGISKSTLIPAKNKVKAKEVVKLYEKIREK